MANRTIESTLQDRIRSRSILFGQLPWVTPGVHEQPLLFSRELGIAGNMQGPRDRAGRSSRSMLAFHDYSHFSKGLVNIPRPTDYLVGTNSTWTVENVLKSTTNNQSIGLLIPPVVPTSTARESSRDAETHEYFEEGAAAFRAGMSETEGSVRATLLANARHSFDVLNQLDVDAARGHLALAVIRYVQDDINTSEVHLVMGLQRSNSLEQMDIGRTNFFPDDDAWQRRLDQLNIVTRTSNNPRLNLLYGYWAFLNGDDVIAMNAAEEARRLYKAILDQARDSETVEVDGEKELEYATRFRDLLQNKIDAPNVDVSNGPAARIEDSRE